MFHMAAFFHKAALFHKSDLFHKAASFHEAALFHTATGESVVCGELPRRVFGSYISANKKPWQKRACVCHNCLSQLFVKIVLAPTRARKPMEVQHWPTVASPWPAKAVHNVDKFFFLSRDKPQSGNVA